MLKYINALRLPLAALVVFIHSYNTAWRGINSQVVDGLGRILSRTLPTFAVPLFFAISGYLFFINQQTFSWKGYVEKLHRRFYTLLIPYVCWNVIAFALYALKDVSAGQLLHLPLSFNLFWGCTQVGGEGANVLGWHVMASTAPVQEPLWFVRDLMVIVLCSPLLYAILRYLKWLGLAIVAIVYYAGLWPNVGGMTLIGVWFFMLGAWCGMNKYDVGGKLARYWPICLVSFIISFGLLLGRGAESFVWHHVYVFSAIVTSTLAKEVQTIKGEFLHLCGSQYRPIAAYHSVGKVGDVSVSFRAISCLYCVSVYCHCSLHNCLSVVATFLPSHSLDCYGR